MRTTHYQQALTHLVTPGLHKALDALYADLGWDRARQEGFNLRVCGHRQPRTTADANKVYQGLEAMLMQRLRPYYPKLVMLVEVLYANRGEMTAWERDTFLPDVYRKTHARDGRADISPAMVKKVREIAHKYDVPTGFPSFKEMAAHYNNATPVRVESNRFQP